MLSYILTYFLASDLCFNWRSKILSCVGYNQPPLVLTLTRTGTIIDENNVFMENSVTPPGIQRPGSLLKYLPNPKTTPPLNPSYL